MFIGIFEVLGNLISELAMRTVLLIANTMIDFAEIDTSLQNIDFKLVLFSDTPIISTNVYDMLMLFFTIFYSMFFIILLYKTTKKIIKSVFGVLKWW